MTFSSSRRHLARHVLSLSLLATLGAQAAVPALPPKTAPSAQPSGHPASSHQAAWTLVSPSAASPAAPAATPVSTAQPMNTAQPVTPTAPAASTAPMPSPAAPAAPSTPTTPAKPKAQLLTVRLEASFPAIVNGKKAMLPYRETLLISPERVAAAQAAGKLSSDTLSLFNDFLKKTIVPARDARFEQQDDGSWLVVQRNALVLDSDAARAALSKAALNGDKLLVLSPKLGAAPKRTLDFFMSRGITSFLAAGQTNYEGSSKARMTNIHAGTKFFQDRLFEGKEFSFNKFIGPISEKAGYVPGLVIAGERTASGIGGGICQVSTTAFRALYGAGFKILERRNHSYQVYYYSPQGLDATIYQPSQDLRFAVSGPLWFQADWDDKAASLVIQVFGKPRDFEVTVQEPRVLKTTPSPADKTIVDKTLKPGEKKQVDWAAQGAVIEVDRTFTRAGKVFQKDTLKSTYKPWPNIFLVGK